MTPDPQHAARTEPTVIDGAVTRRVSRIDLDRVLYGYQRVIDALTEVFAVEPYGRSKAVLPGPHGDAMYWPHPGKDRCISYWYRRANNFAVCGDAIWHEIGLLKVHAYLLGDDHLVFDPATRVLRAARHGPASDVDAVPRIAIVGTGQRRGVGEDIADRVERIVREDLAVFGFLLRKEPAEARDRRRPARVILTVVFTHSDFFRGVGWGLVRCLDPHGRPASNRPRRS